MNKTLCFEAWAGDLFLGYEYGKTQQEATEKCHEKYGLPENWNVETYTINQLTQEC